MYQCLTYACVPFIVPTHAHKYTDCEKSEYIRVWGYERTINYKYDYEIIICSRSK